VDLAKLVTVFALGAVELWAAIPAGLALHVSPVLVAVVAAAGAMLGVLVVVVLGRSAENRRGARIATVRDRAGRP
jgi:membrane protein YqaA with SNARE-associated domain